MESTLRRTWAEINLDAIAHNYKTIREHIGDNVKFLGVVKADAYGHGSVQVSKLLQDLGADYLAVSSIDEGMELRLNGITMPILILGHTPMEQVPRLIEFGITQAVTCKAKAEEYSKAATESGGVLKVHIKVDTGMSRLGYLCDNDNFSTGVEGICQACNLPGLDAEGIFTHFAVADELGDKNLEYTDHQFSLFTRVIEAVEEQIGHKFAIRHCANTGATVRFEKTYLDMVRPGLLLYGYGEFAKEWDLIPAMTLKTCVSTIKTYPAGTAISYGGIFVTDKTTRIAVVPYGYADGFFRSLSNKCYLYTKGGKARQVGKICMDMCMIDVTDMPAVDVGSEVEIFGQHNSIDDLCQIASTIPYELTCAVSKRVPRIYMKDGKLIGKELLLRM
ncbi:MAG: alanine racemase [Pseudobutyrivibrio sp.]|nr:alanine racemase [Pseudobutyrivibrio sp.]